MAIKKGDLVEIVRAYEAEKYKGCIFTVTSDPYTIPSGPELVKMECREINKRFGGGFATEFLRVVGDSEYRYSPAKPEDVIPGYYWLVTPDGEKTIEQIWDGYGDGSLGMESPEGWVTVSEIYELGGVLYSIPQLEVAE